MAALSVVINTLNEEKNIGRAIKSVSWAEEIIVCDMHSEDKTVELAQKLGAKIYFHEPTGYVEPARNFAISCSANDWVLILDADEEVRGDLREKIKQILADPEDLSYVEIPRKNFIFGKWMKASLWWPDYQIRLFKKGSVTWSQQIHIKPETKGKGAKLEPSQDLAITHYHYETVQQYIERLNRYTTVEAKQLEGEGYIFKWQDLLKKPMGEFLSRYFAAAGYKDGLHGLSLAMLQAISFFVVYLKVWQAKRFFEQELGIKELEEVLAENNKQLDHWLKVITLPKNPFKKVVQKVINNLR